MLLTLMSPRFLYHELDQRQGDSYDVAARLSYGLWDSLPDDELLRAAAAGKLTKPDEVRKQAARMVDDMRTRGKLHDFFVQWLRLDRFEELSKDTARFPDFDDAIESDLHSAL